MNYISKFILCLASIFALASCDKSEGEQQTTTTYEGKLTIVPSYERIIAGEGQTVDFTAFIGEEEVTQDETLSIYRRGFGSDKSVKVDGLSYPIEELGEYTFYAICKAGGQSRLSEDVKVEGVTAELGAIEDPNPEKFDSFYKRVPLFQFTGTWCGNCPIVIKAIHTFMEGEQADRVVHTSVHNGDSMASTAAFLFESNVKMSSWPTVLMGDLTRTNGLYFSGQYYEISLNLINEYTEKLLNTPALTAIAARAEEISGMVCVRADVKVARDGAYGIGVLLLEDGIKETQLNYFSSKDLDLTGIDINTHENVLQGIAPEKKPYFTGLGDVSEHKAGEVYSYSCEFDTTTNAMLQNIDNCHVVVFTYDATKYDSAEEAYANRIDNVIDFPVGETHLYEYEN